MNLRHIWKIYGRAFVIALLVLYLPHAVKGFGLVENPVWILGMPGVYIGVAIYQVYEIFADRPPLVAYHLANIFITALLIAVLTIIGARGKPWQICAIVLGGGYSIATAIAIYGWYS